jgi:hypothetical protein
MTTAAAIADHRHAPGAQLGEEGSVEQARARPVEGAIPKDHPFQLTRAGDGRFEGPDRVERPTQFARRLGIERVVFSLDRSSPPRIGPAAEALHDEPPRAAFLGRRDEIVQRRGSQSVGRRKGAIEMDEVARIRKRGHLVHDDLGSRLEDGRSDGVPVESVDDSRLDADLAKRLGFRRRPGEAGDPMTRGEEQRDEAGPDRARRARDQDLHDLPPLLFGPATHAGMERFPFAPRHRDASRACRSPTTTAPAMKSLGSSR